MMAHSVQFSCSVVSDFVILRTAARQASLSITISQSLLKLISLSPWCHPTISASVIPFSCCLQSFPPSGSFQITQFFASCGQSFGSFSFSISPSNEYSGLISFRIGWLVWSPWSPRDSQEPSSTPQFKSINFLALSFLYGSTHIHTWLLKKPHSID